MLQINRVRLGGRVLSLRYHIHRQPVDLSRPTVVTIEEQGASDSTFHSSRFSGGDVIVERRLSGVFRWRSTVFRRIRLERGPDGIV